MAITFGGLSSGLPPNLVDQLIEAERMPIKNLENKKTNHQAKLDLVNDLTAKVRAITDSIGTLASVKGFNDMKLISGDPNAIGGTIDPTSGVSGDWNIEVVELAQKAAAVTNGFPDKDRTEIGVGYFEFETADGTKEVYIDGTNNTLEGAAAAINSANIGIRATVLNDRKTPDAPYKLLLSGDQVGDDNEIEYPTLYFLDGDQDLYFDENREAKNGVIKVDGFEFEIGDNTVEDVIPGVTLQLKQNTQGRSVNISVKEDQEVVGGKIKEFVDALNAVFAFIQQQNRMDQNTDTSRTLGGDSLIRSVESRMTRLVQRAQLGINGSIKRLQDLGIEFNRSGTLDFNEDKFNTVLAQRPEDVGAFFAGDGFTVGFVPNLKRELSTMLDQAFGPLTLRRRNLEDKIRRVDDRIASKEKHLEKKEAALRKKFANLEQTMSRLKSQSGQVQAIASSGGAIPNFGGASTS